jgi:S-adenosyl methyltransferase
MDRPAWVPDSVDLERPSVARIYDYNLGGAHNFAIDRRVAAQMAAAMPDLPAINWANRSFLRRAVRFLVAQGIRQFLDLGSGIPTVGNVHEIAQAAAPESRVAYVDIDAVAAAHGQALLSGNERAIAVQADLRRPDDVLGNPEIPRLLDFRAPIGVLMVAVLHFVADDPAGIIGRYRDAVVPGSYLVVSHATEGGQHERARAATAVAQRNSMPATLRGAAEVAALFAGFELVEPGLVYTPQWRPEPDANEFDGRPERAATLAAVGVKPVSRR